MAIFTVVRGRVILRSSYLRSCIARSYRARHQRWPRSATGGRSIHVVVLDKDAPACIEEDHRRGDAFVQWLKMSATLLLACITRLARSGPSGTAFTSPRPAQRGLGLEIPGDFLRVLWSHKRRPNPPS